jgi:hypothetical protein
MPVEPERLGEDAGDRPALPRFIMRIKRDALGLRQARVD